MKIKQKVKNLISILGLLTILIIPAMSTIAVYASDTCGGVQTSVISCTNQTGICPNGGPVNPFEGANPGTDTTTTGSAAIKAYNAQYHHDYGKCVNGATPVADTTQSGIWGLLLLAINILTAGVGIAAVGGFVYAGILYTSSAGNPEQTKKAIEFIRNIVIGLVAYAVMFSFLNFIIPGGLFG